MATNIIGAFDTQTKKIILWCWMEEYKTCSCTFLALKKSELPGYCGKHGNDRKYKPLRLPYKENDTLGHSHG